MDKNGDNSSCHNFKTMIIPTKFRILIRGSVMSGLREMSEIRLAYPETYARYTEACIDSRIIWCIYLIRNNLTEMSWFNISSDKIL